MEKQKENACTYYGELSLQSSIIYESCIINSMNIINSNISIRLFLLELA